MELLVTLRKKELLNKIGSLVDGVIVGEHFTSGYNYTDDDLKSIRDYCYTARLKYYIVLDNFITEDEEMMLHKYLDLIADLDPDGIFFHDLGVMEAAKVHGLFSKLIYDGKTVLCNSLDSAFMLAKGIDSVMISREITLEEIYEIAKNTDGRINMQIFGHQRLSYSRRKFLSNYFHQINKKYDYLNKESLYLIEEQRDYKMPIVEDDNGTYIYSDYIFEMFREISDLRPYLKRGIIETRFIDNDNFLVQVCRDYHRVNDSNKEFIRDALLYNYPYEYSTGYLYQKTNKTKDE